MKRKPAERGRLSKQSRQARPLKERSLESGTQGGTEVEGEVRMTMETEKLELQGLRHGGSVQFSLEIRRQVI